VEDLSDNEREEQLRRWWADNWLWIVGGIALGLGALAGWNYWQTSKLKAAELDESSYLAVLDALGRDDKEAAIKQASDLRKRHPKSPYADQSDLALARHAVDQRDFDTAVQRLRVVADSSRDAELRLIATTRLARVLAEQGKHEEALKLLDVAQAGAFAPLYHDLRGDILAARNDASGARQAYDAALAATAASPPQGFDREYVELKRDALPAAAPTAAAPAATLPAPTPAAGTQP
jgi:predicted negative regulator of RcsB-dependent stress response